MGKCISIHSSRGGTGKTLLATNLAVLLAKKGSNVALLDLDFRAPSLMGIFPKASGCALDCYLNSYFDGRCPPEVATIDLSKHYGLNTKFLVGLANPDVAAIRNMAEKSRAWEVSAVKRLMALRSKLFNEMGIDYCILDTSPGIQYTSVNAAISSDLSIIITTLDTLDLQGSESMLLDLYDAFEKKTIILLNKVFPSAITPTVEWKAEAIYNTELLLKRPVLGAIPCYCDVLQAKRSAIFAVEKPDHPFVHDLEKVRERLETNI